MSSEEKFKQSLRSLVDSKEFPFQEEDWDKAAAYISRQRGYGLMRRLGLIALLVVSVGSVALLTSDDNRSIAASRQTAPTAAQQPAQPADALTSPEGQAGAVTLPENVATPEEPGSVSESEKEQPMPASGAARKPAAQPAATGEQEASVGGKLNIAVKRSSRRAPQPEIAPVTAVVPDSKKDEPIKEEQLDAGEETKAPIIAPGSAVPASTAPAGAEKPVESLAVNTATAEEQETPAETPTVAPAPEPAAAPPAAPATAKVPDSLLKNIPRRPILSIEAGPSCHFGWKENTGREGNGLNMVAGIHLLSQVNEKIDMSVGIQYQRSGHLGNFQHLSKSSRLSFGEESDVLLITPRKLHYLAAPVRAYYHLDEKNTFGAAYVIGYLLDVESDVESYSLKAGKKSNSKSFSTRGYTDGFRLFDSQLAVFYRRTLGSRFDVHGEIFLGLSDVKQDGFFGNGGAQRNSGLRLMICYKILERAK